MTMPANVFDPNAFNLKVQNALAPIGDITKSIADAKNFAKQMHRRLTQQIIDFEKRLRPNEEVGAAIVGAPDGSVFHIRNVTYWGPDLMIFQGIDTEGRVIELLQHVSQVSVMLIALKVTCEPRRIGFLLEKQLETKQ